MSRFKAFGIVAGLVALLFSTGCEQGFPKGALVVVLTPAKPANPLTGDRLVLVKPYEVAKVVINSNLNVTAQPPTILRVLSEGLYSAESPVVSPNGKRVYFAGKASATSTWQIYEASPAGGRPALRTLMPGGAMTPALLPKGEIVFCSPALDSALRWTTKPPAALYAQREGEAARRLTFGPMSAVDPTVLTDGRILFVSALTSADSNASLSLGLFTIQSDGTEISRFALDRDGAPYVMRPRELSDGRMAFIALHEGNSRHAEVVSLSRPFASRAPLMKDPKEISLLEIAGDKLLFTRLVSKSANLPPRTSVGIYEAPLDNLEAARLILTDPVSQRLEVVSLQPRPQPMGHVSAMSATKKTGIILCMDANFHRDRRVATGQLPKAQQVRILTMVNGNEQRLGELPLESDGSFIAEVPADILLGFETMDASGQLVYRQPPSLWVRAGENRSCVGCHEPYNHSPRNYRPIAANKKPVVLGKGGGL